MQFIFAASAETPVFYARFPRAPPCFARAVRANLLRRAGAKKAELSGSALCENLAWLLRPLSAESEEQDGRAENRGDRRGFGNLPERHRKGSVVPRKFRDCVQEVDRREVGIGVVEIEAVERSRGD